MMVLPETSDGSRVLGNRDGAVRPDGRDSIAFDHDRAALQDFVPFHRDEAGAGVGDGARGPVARDRQGDLDRLLSGSFFFSSLFSSCLVFLVLSLGPFSLLVASLGPGSIERDPVIGRTPNPGDRLARRRPS
jgi:hypothetical protein